MTRLPYDGPGPADEHGGDMRDSGTHDSGVRDGGMGDAAGMHASGMSGTHDGSMDEQTLRQLLQGVVEDIEPAPDSLDQIRRAVPARRTRRRQALVGAAAALILGGTALPAVVHVATTSDAVEGRHANTASSQHTPEEPDAEPDGVSDGAGRPDEGEARNHDEKREERKEEGKKGNEPKPAGSSPAGIPPAPTNTFAAVSPTCDRDQLGKGSGSVGPADRDGRVYGAFRVVNVSRAVCTVGGPGTVAASPRGSAESGRVSVVDHTPGDAATGLPDPTSEPSEVILQPGQAYEVKFAWIPAGGDGGRNGCAKSGGGGSSPAPSAGGGASASPAGSSAAAQQQPVVPDSPPPTPQPSIVLSHTPDVGEPAIADAKIGDACAGTVYRTGPIVPPS
ncbi:hypothetical protein IPZ58_02210 [Streptomyces roseoverticillatus]|uniref:hypothetical protein n=1 Tax=Streptomyces roseoverticillatus TaxID=66429 RepID=UPI001F320E20|nr:hypothetical protein [Streptomyces roseoverticillatus]MCF3100396.1 hypothetical protein [Streptomyces roseoverticillatus]